MLNIKIFDAGNTNLCCTSISTVCITFSTTWIATTTNCRTNAIKLTGYDSTTVNSKHVGKWKFWWIDSTSRAWVYQPQNNNELNWSNDDLKSYLLMLSDQLVTVKDL